MSRLITHGQPVGQVLMQGRRATVIHDGQVLVWDRENLFPEVRTGTTSGITLTFDGTAYHLTGTATAWGGYLNPLVTLTPGHYTLARTVGYTNHVYPEGSVTTLDGQKITVQTGDFTVDHEQAARFSIVHRIGITFSDHVIIPILQKLD